MSGHACIVGWAHTPFGKLDNIDIEELIQAVVRDSIAHAGIQASDIDFAAVGVYNNGLNPQGFEAGLLSLHQPDLRFTPAVHVENACATGSAAIHSVMDAIESGRARIGILEPEQQRLADELGVKSMAFPAIATGVYGYPPDQAADVAIHTLRTTPSSVELVRLIQQIKTQFNLAVLLVEHSMKVVMGCCERIAVLDYGVKIAEGTPAEIQSDPVRFGYFLGIRQLVGEGHDQFVDDMYSSNDGRLVVISRPSFGDVVAISLRTRRIVWRFAVAGVRSDHMAISPDGTRLLVDAGPDLRAQALTHGIVRVDAIFFTHGQCCVAGSRACSRRASCRPSPSSAWRG